MADVTVRSDDLFNFLKDKMKYDYISDLRDMNKNIDNNLDYVLLVIDANNYDVAQWQDLTHYLFPCAGTDLSANAEQLRNALILAIYEYRNIKERIARNKITH